MHNDMLFQILAKGVVVEKMGPNITTSQFFKKNNLGH